MTARHRTQRNASSQSEGPPARAALGCRRRAALSRGGGLGSPRVLIVIRSGPGLPPGGAGARWRWPGVAGVGGPLAAALELLLSVLLNFLTPAWRSCPFGRLTSSWTLCVHLDLKCSQHVHVRLNFTLHLCVLVLVVSWISLCAFASFLSAFLRSFNSPHEIYFTLELSRS